MVWYGMVGPDQSLAIIMVGPLGRVGQRLLLRVVLLAPNQIIVRLNLGPRIALGEVRYRLKIKGTICYLLSVCAHLPSHQRNSHEIRARSNNLRK